MSGVYKFHNKLHRANHHTIIGNGNPIPDAGTDPIASQAFPFLGVFYNLLTDSGRSFNILTNSLEWWSSYKTVESLSAIWAPTLSVWTTVNQLSTYWNLGYDGYTTFKSNSSIYESTYTTVSANSAIWGSPYIVYTNIPQQFTKSKTFSGQDLTVSVLDDTVSWNLSSQQICFITLTKNISVLNPYPIITNSNKGGLYTMVLSQDAIGGWDASFDTSYRFPETTNRTNIIGTSANSTTVLNFVCDGVLMYADVVKTFPSP
jgi:hypothetical protein